MIINNNESEWTDKLIKFYTDYLKEVILPFWLKRGIDNEFGGFFTCFNDSNGILVSTDKFTWSQGRMVWIMSQLSTLDIFTEQERDDFLSLAHKGAEFLMNNCLLDNGNCTFVMTREGTPKPMKSGDLLDLGIEADLFVVMGLSRYALVSGNKKALDFAVDLFNTTQERVKMDNAISYPYPMPVGYKSPPMMLLYITHELGLATAEFNNPESFLYDAIANKSLEEILSIFISEDYIAHEKITINNEFENDTLMGRYINPGHTIEDMWFVIHQALRENNNDAIINATKIVKKTFELGWDNEFGGLLLFVDQDGGKPCGSIEGAEEEVMVFKVLNDWDSKLWWPHSEALYTTLLSYFMTKDTSFLALYSKVHEYTFKTFPNPNKEIGEWIHIRNRRGEPEDKVVALPVKDPFHIIRNIILIIKLLESST